MKNEINMIFPTVLVEKLENLFKDEKIDFNKVLFTVYYINNGKWNSLKQKRESYQELSSRYGNWISLVGKKGTEFIKKLVDGNIIKKTGGYVTAKHYTRYTLVTPFNTENKNAKGDNYRLYTLTPENGAYVAKYINDGYIVRIPSKPVTKVKEAVKTPTTEVIQQNTKTEIEDLKNLVEQQQKQINEMLKQMEDMKKMIISSNTVTTIKEETEEEYLPAMAIDTQGNLIFTAVDVEIHDIRQEEATSKLKAMLAELDF